MDKQLEFSKQELNQNEQDNSQQYRNTEQTNSEQSGSSVLNPESIVKLPKGGGAISGIGEKFQVNPVTGTANITVPIAMSAGRSEFTPQLALSYDSGSGNSPFGLGWNIGLPNITRKTAKGLPQYIDSPFLEGQNKDIKSDTYILSGAEDLVPLLVEDGDQTVVKRTVVGDYVIVEYRPRIDGLFAKIEKYSNTNGLESYWKTISKENIETYYGYTENSRVFDSENPQKIFSWLISKTIDSNGNIIIYEYKQENNENITKSLHEKNRLKNNNAFNKKYLKRVKYGNTIPSVEGNWLFQLVLDYGEHNLSSSPYDETLTWACREDVFSTYSAGFEIRTYRLCKQILMFHQFTELVLVKSTTLNYKPNGIATKLESVQHFAHQYIENVLNSEDLPPVSFTYSQAVIDNNVYTFEIEDLKDIPAGLDGKINRWADINDEGISGILTETNNAWYFKQNLGDKNYYQNYTAGTQTEPKPHFERTRIIAQKPNVANLQSGIGQFSDIDGDGKTEIMILSGDIKGYYENISEFKNSSQEFSTAAQGTKDWVLKTFTQFPNINMSDPNLKFLDITGDGHADIVITEQNCFVCYESLAKEGYKSAFKTIKAIDEEKGPAIVFADVQQSIYMADMSGDGLTDIVRIRNNEVCYWANLGYGKFSQKITMSNAPLMDYFDKFNQSRIRLIDVDGSGTTDILYIGDKTIKYWENQSGNSFSDAHEISNFPNTDNIASVAAVDLMGNGTACLVWSSPLPAHKPYSVKFIDLMSGTKPYLITQMDNNMGSTTEYQYAPSTKFYLRAKREGKPWITKLPFPVHVLERVAITDHVTNNNFVTRYAYHHGYFDPFEKEFRGFGLVEQWDTETYEYFNANFPAGGNTLEESSHIPPVYTKTWFHNGFYKNKKQITALYAQEYFNTGLDSFYAGFEVKTEDNVFLGNLPDSVLEQQIIDADYRTIAEACRALKGKMLRTEWF